MGNAVQKITMFMDDSGKFNANEKYCVYAGLIFLSKSKKDKFIGKYKSINKRIKCKYCGQDNGKCNGDCDEVKSYLLEESDRRQILNLIKKEYAFSLVINNQKVYPNIINDKASRGRFTDYSQKIMIKSIINYLIRNGSIDPNLPVELIINSDESTTISNGYYTLEKSIYEELVHGIYNFNYNTVHKPVLLNSFSIKINYLDSKKTWCVQASDILAGKIRRQVIQSSNPFYAGKAEYCNVNIVEP